MTDPTAPQNVPPQNVVVVLLDSLNRHMLGAYGGAEFATPNLDRFAASTPRASPTTSPVRCRACPPATTSSAARSTSSGSRGARSSCGRSRSPPTLRRRRGHDDARVRSPAPVRDRRRELPHRLQRLGLRARPRGRPVAHRRRPVGVRDARHCRRVDGGWFIRERFGIDDAKVGRRHYDDSRTWFRAEDDFPGPRTMRSRRVAGCATRRSAPRPVDAVRRRVRPARAVRHARAVGVDVRRRAVGRRAADLAAVHRRRHRRGQLDRAARAATSGPTTAPSCR